MTVASPDSPDSDDQYELQQVEDLPKRNRIYRKPYRAGEKEQSSWAYCCQCDMTGEIMSWPQCRNCLHNRCGYCEYSTESTNVDPKQADEQPTASLDKVNEDSRGLRLKLESLVLDGTLTSPQIELLPKVLDALELFRQNLFELENAEMGGAGYRSIATKQYFTVRKEAPV
jgi:hypothetical protein